ncbi:MAG TPA: hypothetical protein VGP90_03105 [Acidimicrobiia bacterium]|nr:hypothetical protein [Acidimicrobiia bacterium]
MVFTVFKIAVAIGAFFCIYLTGTFIVRSFTHLPAEPEVGRLRRVDYRYRCTVCGTEVTKTAAPEDDIPHAPRHCREDMILVVEGGEY